MLESRLGLVRDIAGVMVELGSGELDAAQLPACAQPYLLPARTARPEPLLPLGRAPRPRGCASRHGSRSAAWHRAQGLCLIRPKHASKRC